VTLLSDYEAQVADLLHDPNNVIWSTLQLDRYINEARRQLVMDTGCLRVLQTAYLWAGQESYTFGQVTGAVINAAGSHYVTPVVNFTGGGGSGVAATATQSGGAVNALVFSSFGGGYTSAPAVTITDVGGGTGAQVVAGVISANTYDVLGVSVVWGTERYALFWAAFSNFSAKLRVWLSTAYQRQPECWAVYGNTQFFVGPPPDQPYQFEVDSLVLPTPLADYTTIDPIPVVVQDPIKFYAAHLAKMNNQAYGEAEMMLAAYNRRMHEVEAAYTRRIPNPYEV
jgi:hypothetical protein